MLKLCENIEELGFLPADPFCARISAYALTYGFDNDSARFYLQGEASALSLADGTVTLWCTENTDYDEINTFLPFLGCKSIIASEETFGKLGIEPEKTSYIVKYEGGSSVKPNAFTDIFEGKEVYDLLTRCGFDMGSYRNFIESIGIRLNKKTASFGGIKNAELEACAFRLFEGEKSVLLGAVATSPEHRGKGLASSLVPYMVSDCKDSFLFCRNDNLLEFYKKCGFALWGRWAENNGVIF